MAQMVHEEYELVLKGFKQSDNKGAQANQVVAKTQTVQQMRAQRRDRHGTLARNEQVENALFALELPDTVPAKAKHRTDRLLRHALPSNLQRPSV